jgi:phage terminase Nu1 subunit (DNA packaging protein)
VEEVSKRTYARKDEGVHDNAHKEEWDNFEHELAIHGLQRRVRATTHLTELVKVLVELEHEEDRASGVLLGFEVKCQSDPTHKTTSMATSMP